MNLQHFFSAMQAGSLETHPVILCGAEEYPALFFASLCAYIRKNYRSELKNVVFEGIPFASLQAQFSTTFLGRKDLLWLGDISSIEDNQTKKQLITFLTSYQGPHTLIGFIKPTDWKHKTIPLILLEEPLSEGDIKTIFTYLFQGTDPARVADLFKMVPKASLDQKVMLMQYLPFLGKNSAEFKERWIIKLMGAERSLFDLSTYFFARKATLFWNLWATLQEEYAPPFWTTYWSEQLYRAAMMVEAYQKNNVLEGKQFAYRLPFSFIQKDWRLHSVDSLRKAHSFLYEADCSFKNGSTPFGLDVFYATFLAKQF